MSPNAPLRAQKAVTCTTGGDETSVLLLPMSAGTSVERMSPPHGVASRQPLEVSSDPTLWTTIRLVGLLSERIVVDTSIGETPRDRTSAEAMLR